jgi:hypothetical protein
MMIEGELPVNMEILGQPMNWLIITVILVFVSYAAYCVSQHAAQLIPKV